jgi:hypothetical protein
VWFKLALYYTTINGARLGGAVITDFYYTQQRKQQKNATLFLPHIGAKSPAQKFKYSIFKKYAAHFLEL